MNFNKLQRTIILLLVSLLISHCGCDKGKSGNNKQSTEKKGRNPELTEEQKKQKQEEELKNLINQEKELEKKTKDTLFQLKQLPGPGKAFIEAISIHLEDEIETSKDNGEEAKKLLDDKLKIKTDLLKFKEKFNSEEKILLKDYHPNIIDVLQVIIDNLDPELKDAKAKDRPINPINLSADEKQFYDRIVAKYPAAKKSYGTYFNKAVLETIQDILKATNASLALFENIHRQHELKKGKS